MTSGNRVILTAGLLFALMGGLTQFDPEGMAALGLDWRQLPDSLREYNAALLQEQQLMVQEAQIHRCLIQKNQLIRDLIAGRVSFLEASAWFMHLNQIDHTPYEYAFHFAGASLEEKACRQVIHWVETHMHYNPKTRSEAFLRQLRKELADRAAQPQGIQLPVMDE